MNLRCIVSVKGKDHKKYEFGSKASIAVTTNSGIIVGAVHFSTNIYDGHTLPATLTQTTELVGSRLSKKGLSFTQHLNQ